MRVAKRIPIEIVSVQEDKCFTVKEREREPEPGLVTEEDRVLPIMPMGTLIDLDRDLLKAGALGTVAVFEDGSRVVVLED